MAINHAPNPSFESDLSSWSTFALDTWERVESPTPKFGDYSAHAVFDGATLGGVFYTSGSNAPTGGEHWMTVSACVSGTGTCDLIVNWWTAGYTVRRWDRVPMTLTSTPTWYHISATTEAGDSIDEGNLLIGSLTAVVTAEIYVDLVRIEYLPLSEINNAALHRTIRRQFQLRPY